MSLLLLRVILTQLLEYLLEHSIGYITELAVSRNVIFVVINEAALGILFALALGWWRSIVVTTLWSVWLIAFVVIFITIAFLIAVIAFLWCTVLISVCKHASLLLLHSSFFVL